MEVLEKKAGIETPYINFNPETGNLIIEGKSFPPDVIAYYQDVLDWLNEYMKKPAEKTVLTLKLDYFNTASSKILMDILFKMEEIYNKGHHVRVEWYYMEDDEDMLETGNEYAELVKVPFTSIGYKFMMDD